jgi:hypothetical protein
MGIEHKRFQLAVAANLGGAQSNKGTRPADGCCERAVNLGDTSSAAIRLIPDTMFITRRVTAFCMRRRKLAALSPL